MRELKLRARALTCGRKAAALTFAELRFLADAGAALCFIYAVTLGAGGAPFALGEKLRVSAALGLVLAAGLCLLFAKTAKAGLADYLLRHDPDAPVTGCLSLSRGLRQLEADALAAVRQIMLALALSLPAASVLTVLYAAAKTGVPPDVLRGGALLSAAMLTGAAITFFALRELGRMTAFYLAEYPSITAKKALRLSREAAGRHLGLLLRLRFFLWPWRVFGAFLPVFPFVLTYTALAEQLTLQKILKNSKKF